MRARRRDLVVQIGLLAVPLVGGVVLAIRAASSDSWPQVVGVVIAVLAALALMVNVALAYQRRTLRLLASQHQIAYECMLPDAGRGSRFVLTADPGCVEVRALATGAQVQRRWEGRPPRIEPVLVDLVTRHLPGVRIGDEGTEVVVAVASALRWMRPSERDQIVTDLIRVTGSPQP